MKKGFLFLSMIVFQISCAMDPAGMRQRNINRLHQCVKVFNENSPDLLFASAVSAAARDGMVYLALTTNPPIDSSTRLKIELVQLGLFCFLGGASVMSDCCTECARPHFE